MKHAFVFKACMHLLLLLLLLDTSDSVCKVNALNSTECYSNRLLTQNSDFALSGAPDTTPVIPSPQTFIYPDPILQKLDLTPSDVSTHQSEFTRKQIHKDWMDHVDDVLPEISPEKKGAISKTHTSLLFIKDRLDNAFFTNKINKQDYTTQLTGLMQWFQETNRSILNEEEYNALLGISGQNKTPASVSSSDDKLGFPIHNPSTSVVMIKNKFDDQTIADITRFYQQHSQELDDIRQMHETGGIPGVETEQIKMDMLRIEKELMITFKDFCRNRLSEEQFELLFDSPKDP